MTSPGDDPSGKIAGVVTLRDAINAVNNDHTDTAGNPDTIKFNIAGTPAINLAADLPAITNPVLIDGSSQAGVTIDGQASAGANGYQGFAILVVSSAVTEKSVTFTDGPLTVNTGGSLSVTGDFTLGDASGDRTLVQNHGRLSVSGNVVAGDNTGVNNYSGATFHVDGAYTAGQDSYVYDFGTAAFSVTDDFTLGDYGFLYNGLSSTDQATCTVGGSFSIGVNGFVYNYGQSAFKVSKDFTLGDDGFLNNGADFASTDAATFKVGGNFSIGADGYVLNDGTSTITVAKGFSLGDYGYLHNGESSTDAATLKVGGNFSIGPDSEGVYNQGASVLTVGGDFTIGDGGFVYNGTGASDAATLTVGGNFTLGVSGGSGAFVYNEGASALHVKGDFTLHGNYTFVYNGAFSTDAATFTVRGNFSLDANSYLYDYGTSALTVTGNFTMGASSYFVNYGTMSVSGAFDPGSASTSSNDIVAGVFNAEAGSSVTTDAAIFEVQAGGRLNVHAGATFTVPVGGTLLDDSDGRVTVGGAMTVDGVFTSQPGGIVVVHKRGSIVTANGGQVNI